MQISNNTKHMLQDHDAEHYKYMDEETHTNGEKAAANSNTLEGMRAALADLVIGGRHDHASARELMDSIIRLTSDEAEKHELSRMRRIVFQ